jgi:carbamoyltransferase
LRILGISAFYHDSAAVLVENGRVLAAAQEERFSRRKHDARFPAQAIAYCLEEGGGDLGALDSVVFYEKPLLKFNRLLKTYTAFAPRGFGSFAAAMPVWLNEKLFQKDLLAKAMAQYAGDFDWRGKLLFSEHHLSHAASAFFPSPFESAAVLTMDGVGEWTTSSLSLGQGNRLEIHKEIHFPHSLGLLYSAFTQYTGFAVNEGEYKLMGLAPYGEPKYAQLILDRLIDLKEDGSFRLDQSYFDYCTGFSMISPRFVDSVPPPPPKPDQLLTQFHMDVAASIQTVTEEAVLRLCRAIRKETGARKLCLAGGVALNCVANGKVLREGIFDDIWIQPAAGDAGGALGAALVAYHLYKNQPRQVNNRLDGMSGAYLGPAFNRDKIHADLDRNRAVYHDLDDRRLIDETVAALVEGKVVGWFQGRMEFGPRALGARSILADPRSPAMQRILNLKIKYRESFRPFAPAVLREDVGDWFELDADSPYMLLVADVQKRHRRAMTAEERALFGIDKLNVVRSAIPAVTHVDYSARIQTVHADTNPRFHALLSAFKAETGCPVLVNTSFNVRDEPIVCTPEDAYRCFMATEMDLLVIGNTVLRKDEQRRPSVAPTARGDALVPAELLACLRAPGGSDRAALERVAGGFRCSESGAIYPDRDGVPSLLTGIDGGEEGITGRIKAFYEEHPFPNYEGTQDFGSLVVRGQKSDFVRALLNAAGRNNLILECGCGTGQMSNFLCLNNNFVLGIDLSLSSLKLGLGHKQNNDLRRVAFCQMDIFDLAIKDESFDVVVSTGVLHHTKDAKRAFAAIARKAKPGGLVVVGLYNSYARIPTKVRSKLIGVLGVDIDYVVRNRIRDRRKAEIWVKDQYYNPHETWHTIDEVMGWFDENGIEYLGCRPPILGVDSPAREDLSVKTSPGTELGRIATQIAWLGTIAREGALFVVAGRRGAASR